VRRSRGGVPRAHRAAGRDDRPGDTLRYGQPRHRLVRRHHGRACVFAGSGRGETEPRPPASGARWFLEEGLRVTLDDYLAARRRRFGYVRELDELLGDNGVVLSPTIAAHGWLAEGRLSASDHVGALPGDVYNTSLQNLTGHPALSLPACRLPNGLPFGLQVTGPRFHDPLLLALADSWEEVRPWPRVADGYEPFDVGIAG